MERIVLRHLTGSKSQQIEEFPLDGAAEVVFGRDPSATVRYDPDRDDLVGRTHARLTQDPTGKFRFTITDLSSRNGTYVNRQRVVTPVAVGPGDVIQFGPGGPELQFDIEPLPPSLMRATRIANAPDPSVPGARVAATVHAAPAPVPPPGAPAALPSPRRTRAVADATSAHVIDVVTGHVEVYVNGTLQGQTPYHYNARNHEVAGLELRQADDQPLQQRFDVTLRSLDLNDTTVVDTYAMTPFHFLASALSDVGCVRTSNEDQVRLVHVHDDGVLAHRGFLLLVADGMGGHLAGEVASQVAVDTVHNIYYDCAGSPRDALVRAFEAANHAVYALAEHDMRLSGMGTTGTALVLCGDHAFSANVGDSRIYLVRDRGIYRMTSDDSAVGELVSQGIISAADARHHAEKNLILRAIGTAPAVTVSTWDKPFPIRDGDRFLLCSDGLHDLVDDDEIRDAVILDTPAESCEQLVALARERGGHDNITVAVAHVVAQQASEASAKITREMRPLA